MEVSLVMQQHLGTHLVMAIQPMAVMMLTQMNTQSLSHLLDQVVNYTLSRSTETTSLRQAIAVETFLYP